MENKLENIKTEIEERLKELANIQPKKDALKYLEKCEKTYKAYYMAKGVASRYPDLGDDILRVFEDVLEEAKKALEEDF